MYFVCVCFRGDLGFLNCYDIYMCVVNRQFELLELVFDSAYVDLQYDAISLTFTAGFVSLFCVCSDVSVFDMSVRLPWYPMLWMRWLLWLWCVYCCLCFRYVCCESVIVRGWWQCCCGAWMKWGCGEGMESGWYALFS